MMTSNQSHRHAGLLLALLVTAAFVPRSVQGAAEKLLPEIQKGTYVYELTLDTTTTRGAPGSDTGSEKSSTKLSAAVKYVLTYAPEEGAPVGLCVYRVFDSQCDLLGYRGSVTTLLGNTICKASVKKPGIFVIGSRTAGLTDLDPLARRIWASYRVYYPLPESPVGVGDKWGDSKSEEIAGGRATVDVRSRFDRMEEFKGRQCAVFAGSFEMRSRAGGENVKTPRVEVVYSGEWEAFYDPQAKVVLRQTGRTDALLDSTPAEGRGKRTLSSTHTDFEAVLKPDETAPEGPSPASDPERYFLTAWKLLAAPAAISKDLCERARKLLAGASQASPKTAEYYELQALIPTPGPNGLEGDLLILQKAADLEPNEPRLAFQLGLFHLALRDPEGALASFQHAAKLDPKNALPLYMAAYVQQSQEDPKAAAATLAEANQRPAVSVYLPPPPKGMQIDPASMIGMLRTVSLDTVLRRVRALATGQIEYARDVSDGKKDEDAVRVAEAVRLMGRRVMRATPGSVASAAIGAEIMETSIVRLQISYRTRKDDETLATLDSETKQIEALREKLREYRTASRSAQVLRLSVLTPVITSPAAPPLPLAHPVYLDEQAAVAAAVEAAFTAPAKKPEAPPAE